MIGVGNGYEKIKSELTLFKLDSEGSFVAGIYQGIEMINIPDGQAPYAVLEESDGEHVAIAINASLERALKQVETGDSIAIELAELIASKKGNPFKKYCVYRKKNPSEDSPQEIPF